MPAERVSMRQIREVLRLRFASELPQRAIAKSLGLSQGAVSGYLSRARAAGVSWRLAADLDDVQLEALLSPPPPEIAADQRPMPDPGCIELHIRRGGMEPKAAGLDRGTCPRLRLFRQLHPPDD
jgi:DNA-binding Lrp family transcriptional regulator